MRERSSSLPHASLHVSRQRSNTPSRLRNGTTHSEDTPTTTRETNEAFQADNLMRALGDVLCAERSASMGRHNGPGPFVTTSNLAPAIEIQRQSSQSSSCSRSEAHSVPGDSALSPMMQLPQQHPGIPSPLTAASFDLRTVPMQYAMAGAPPCPRHLQHQQAQSYSHSSHPPADVPMTPSATGHSASGHSSLQGHGINLSAEDQMQRMSHRASRVPGVDRRDSIISSPRQRRTSKTSQASLRRRSKNNRLVLTSSMLSRMSPTAERISPLLQPSVEERPFPWKQVNIAEVKQRLSPQQLQQIVLQSMREYGGTQEHALVLEDFESIPLELEHCMNRVTELKGGLIALAMP